MNIGSVIKKYRKEIGLTQEEMANRLCSGFPVWFLSKEKGL